MIELVELTKRFGNLIAVDSISLKINSGEIFCFLGPNGAGKTTTVKMIAGLLIPDKGTVSVCNVNIHQDGGIHARRFIGYIPDNPYMYERLTCREFCRFVGKLYRIRYEIIEEQIEYWFQILGLKVYSDTLIKDLSHGNRQRLAYAATFIHYPRVLLVDEPFTGLDPYMIKVMKDVFRDMARNGKTILITTHILTLAEQLADRIGIILKGRLEITGTLTELYNKFNCNTLEEIFLKVGGLSC